MEKIASEIRYKAAEPVTLTLIFEIHAVVYGRWKCTGINTQSGSTLTLTIYDAGQTYGHGNPLYCVILKTRQKWW